ncbi:uracil-xanthine permease family protein [Gemella haemolysans]|uniref:Permease n=1 Tax=Gemella haemolysans ATCC 10379 TaxID=546270 RepID=C5NXX3_9BACL|nr:solute carrier family 23 protein [Gemella haemolysans]EER67600.1 putative permease [Gemella haemolysans ATCC 10379]KAA8708892.1 purine permease [Gemella haemolysans]UBH82832.1 purine/pyrimidine permease [Gemella haemolysans]
MTKQNKHLTIGVEENIPFSQSLILGLQHVLAMDVYVPPFILATAIALSPGDATGLIQSTFLGAGIASLIQVLFYLRLPVCQGPSFIPLGAIIGIYMGTKNLGTVLGASIVGAILVILLGYSGIYKYIVKNYIPSIVSGTIIMIVGLTLLPSAFVSNIYIQGNGLTMKQNVLLAFITATSLILFSTLGNYVNKFKRIFQISSVIIALAIGTFSAYLMGGFNTQGIKDASFFSMPKLLFLDYSIHFEISAIITMIIIYMVLLAETTGTWYAVSSVIDEPLSDTQVNKGVIGEGIGCLAASLVGATPVTGYSTNAGIISITGVASRKVFVMASFWFIGLSFLGKLSAIINSIPSAVIGGVFSVVCIIILLNGFRVVKNLDFSERELYIIGVPLMFTIGLLFIPAELKASAPQLLQYLIGSPIAVGAIVAIIMNKLIPLEK